MFSTLQEQLSSTLRQLRGQARLTESNIEEAIKKIRLSLLEADVNFKVVKAFVERVKTKSLGFEVISSVTAGQQFTKIVHDELIATLGGEAVHIDVRKSPSFVMLVGLQGAGKTTTAAKLALYLRKKHQKAVGLVPLDVYRPAAIEQLKQLGASQNIKVYPTSATDRPENIAQQVAEWMKRELLDVAILDTAGRLQIDEALMQELSKIKAELQPKEILLVADAMLGQQAVDVASGFHQQVGLTGLILTKTDGDARGGAALSIRETTGIPIKFFGAGEKPTDFEVFHPDRLASRILDMGDVVSLVEKASELIDQKQAEESAKKMAKNQFTIEDFLSQLKMLKKMGGMQSILGMLPGMGQLKKQMEGMTPPDDEMKKIEAIISSMTKKERHNYKILNGSRRARIAKGSGTEVKDVNKFIKQFEQTQKMMSQMMKMGGKGGFGGMGGLNPFGGAGRRPF